MHEARNLTPEAFTAWNDAMAEKYDPDRYHHHPNPLIRWVEARRTAAIVNLLDVRLNDRVLEVGCGAGNILERIKEGTLTGVDLSAYLLGKARTKLAGRGAELLQGDAEDLRGVLPSRTFSAIYCSEVLEHVQHPDRVVAEMAALAAPDARIVISVPNESLINRVKHVLSLFGVLGRMFPGVARNMEDEWHVHHFGRQELEEVARPHFRLVTLVGIPFGWLPLRYVARFAKR